MRLGAVGAGIHVRPAGYADAGQMLDQRRHRFVLDRSQHDRQAAGLLHGARVHDAERELGLLQVALRERLGVLLAPHLRGGDADQRASTHVSLNPPFWVELTTTAPSSDA